MGSGGVVDTGDSTTAGDQYSAVYDSAQFQALQRRSNTFIVWASVLFYGWWFTGIVLAAFAPGVFRQGVGGPLNVGILFLVLSFVLVGVVCLAYMRFASKRLDPVSDRIRADLEGGLR
ncbi:DUF485 domain-containing protein [Asanoa iriomotensis]|uniref:DUF485 domain-containing protein n=1 Tax=Asanoa iriomotensis TaxID=234613 RepID=A0ABQ4C3I9_9ACTN|nr:DUF485 domain-containing protein [Asanoa iriomotensis]GIF57337.1 hypothetical protein Air01nite_34320 [Asanoa iriomotensis]